MYSPGCPSSSGSCSIYWCHCQEAYPGSCSGLSPRSLLSHPGHQRSQFTSLIGTGVTLCSFSRTSTTRARALSVIGPSVWNGLPLSQRLPPGFFLTHFTLASKLFLLAVKGSGATDIITLESVIISVE